jgi:hypothetical protein
MKRMFLSIGVLCLTLGLITSCKSTQKKEGGEKLIYRINFGFESGGTFTDKKGNEWTADVEKKGWDYSEESQGVQREGIEVKKTDIPGLYTTERWGMENITLNAEAGKYRVILYFAETYEGASEPGVRIFDVAINGKMIAENLDLSKEAGFQTALVKNVPGISPVDGKITITFTIKENNPEINGLELYKMQ